MDLILVGYFAKPIVPRPEWLGAAAIAEVCSVSHCVSAAPDDWIERWLHNGLGFFDNPDRARQVASGVPEARLFAYRFFPARFENGRQQSWQPAGVDPLPLDDRFVSLGFDAVSKSMDEALGFECSPLTCNSMAEGVSTNEHGLVATLDEALQLARSFSVEEPEPGPYYVAEVLERR